MRLLKKQRCSYSELENWLLTHFEWDFVSEAELEILYSQIKPDASYKYPVASATLNAGAIALFKRICSQISISYYEVEEIFLEQNRDFFNSTELLSKRCYSEDKGNIFIKFFNTLIVPKPTDVEKLLNKIRKLSPEDQAEALLLIANKKIKIIVEDI